MSTRKERQRARRQANSAHNRKVREYFQKEIKPNIIISEQVGTDYGLVVHIQGFLCETEADVYTNSLRSQLCWPEARQKMPGVQVDHPRDQLFFGDSGIGPYRYPGGQSMPPQPFQDAIEELRKDVRKRLSLVHISAFHPEPRELSRYFDAKFPNSALAIRYCSEKDSSGLHADKQLDLGYNREIVAVSLGCTRTLHFRTAKDNKLVAEIKLESGDALVMVGWLVQSLYKHELIKSKEPSDSVRICVSFRFHLSEEELEQLKRMDDLVTISAHEMLKRASSLLDEREDHREKTRKSLLTKMHQQKQVKAGVEPMSKRLRLNL
eukprot:TRINITY_DN206_c0_g4_i1.p1 TRINITY_DN206_c0_g4~~TRINITY_DN206_c0_g4_i1.p1  ORF type:complete len:322 (-),score=53.00 TRINITY_DN206_c0_g4_i1:925-1890(-)